MLGLGATLLENLAGPYLRTIVLPVLFLSALTFGKIAWDKRDARLIREGERICNANWEKEIRQQERAQVEADIRAGRKIIEVERTIDEGLTNDLQALQSSIEILRTPVDGSASCLSDGVLNLLGQGEAGRTKAGAGKAGKPAS